MHVVLLCDGTKQRLNTIFSTVLRDCSLQAQLGSLLCMNSLFQQTGSHD